MHWISTSKVNISYQDVWESPWWLHEESWSWQLQFQGYRGQDLISFQVWCPCLLSPFCLCSVVCEILLWALLLNFLCVFILWRQIFFMTSDLFFQKFVNILWKGKCLEDKFVFIHFCFICVSLFKAIPFFDLKILKCVLNFKCF